MSADPAFVRRQYATETGLEARASLYGETTGPFAGDVAFQALAEASPGHVLDVGCGRGWFGARVRQELGADVVAVDQSERMVALAREAGLDARLGDVRDLPFDDGEFDCAAAHWMLYHVPDVDGALAELARVLRAGGRLVAITNGRDHLLELWDVLGVREERLARQITFSAENGEASLRRHFDRVEVRDASGTVTIRDRAAVLRYLHSAETLAPLVERLPDVVPLPLVARRSNVVLVADKE